MAYSLQSRDLIADSLETMMGGHFYDGDPPPVTCLTLTQSRRKSSRGGGLSSCGWGCVGLLSKHLDSGLRQEHARSGHGDGEGETPPPPPPPQPQTAPQLTSLLVQK